MRIIHSDIEMFTEAINQVRVSVSIKVDGKLAERGIRKVSSWAEAAWEEVTNNGYFDEPGRAL
ncbi:hypothetical protein [Paenibacillus sp. SN-8-1]|uniref:hypothetical protein n=1 Tax=Paenibacillus sp. SN-8-1 TaxID=3435409 RepID=UPI003D9A9A40